MSFKLLHIITNAANLRLSAELCAKAIVDNSKKKNRCTHEKIFQHKNYVLLHKKHNKICTAQQKPLFYVEITKIKNVKATTKTKEGKSLPLILKFREGLLDYDTQ